MPPAFASPSAPLDSEKIWSARALRDLPLVAAALAGQAKAYEQLVQHYRKSVYYTVLKMVRQPADADDLTSEVLVKAFRHLPRYRPDHAFSTWLFRIATNHGIDLLRRKRLPTLSLPAGPPTGSGEETRWEVSDPDPTPYETCVRQQRAEVAREAVSRLPPKYQRLVRLRYFDELSYEEIAVELQIPLGTVKAQLFRAWELLLDFLKHSPAGL